MDLNLDTNENAFSGVKIHQENSSELSRYTALADRISILEKQFQLKNLDSLNSKVKIDFENGIIRILDDNGFTATLIEGD